MRKIIKGIVVGVVIAVIFPIGITVSSSVAGEAVTRSSAVRPTTVSVQKAPVPSPSIANRNASSFSRTSDRAAMSLQNSGNSLTIQGFPGGQTIMPRTVSPRVNPSATQGNGKSSSSFLPVRSQAGVGSGMVIGTRGSGELNSNAGFAILIKMEKSLQSGLKASPSGIVTKARLPKMNRILEGLHREESAVNPREPVPENDFDSMISVDTGLSGDQKGSLWSPDDPHGNAGGSGGNRSWGDKRGPLDGLTPPGKNPLDGMNGWFGISDGPPNPSGGRRADEEGDRQTRAWAAYDVHRDIIVDVAHDGQKPNGNLEFPGLSSEQNKNVNDRILYTKHAIDNVMRNFTETNMKIYDEWRANLLDYVDHVYKPEPKPQDGPDSDGSSGGIDSVRAWAATHPGITSGLADGLRTPEDETGSTGLGWFREKGRGWVDTSFGLRTPEDETGATRLGWLHTRGGPRSPKYSNFYKWHKGAPIDPVER